MPGPGRPLPLLPVLLACLVLPACSRGERLHQLKVDQVYQELCATCHGENLDGGLGGSFIDGEWKHGASDEAIYDSIARGNEQFGMVPYEGVLTPEQIRAMVIFLREHETRAALRRDPPPRPEGQAVTRTDRADYRVETMVGSGLDIPWALAFLPDGRKLVTERPGTLRIIDAAWNLLPEPVEDIPSVAHHGQGGLMEVALHPDYPSNGWLYLGLSEGREGQRDRKPCMTAVFRGRLREGRWTDEEVIWRADERYYGNSGVHFGTRFVFQDGYLYFIVGERGGWHEAQDLSRPNGKIFRLHDDGRVPDDNPFVDHPNALPGIWSYGHRNPQGFDIEPGTGDLYITEHGPRGGDELNLVRPGRNYGWPVITHGMNYSGKPITQETAREGMEQPVIHWTPSIAPCGLDFYRGDKFPGWKGDLFAGALAQQEVRRLRIRDRRVTEQEIILKGLGRVRDVVSGPDGYLYIVLNRPGRILRLVPASAPR